MCAEITGDIYLSFFVRLKTRSIFNLSQLVAIEIRGSASIISKKKEKK